MFRVGVGLSFGLFRGVEVRWFVDVRWRMCTGGSRVYWGPCMAVSMLSSGLYVVEDPGAS